MSHASPSASSTESKLDPSIGKETAPNELDAAAALRELSDFFARGPIFVLTGAGVSTDSGIPAYRDERGEWQRPQRPVEYRRFMDFEATRRRYWARSMLGWPSFDRAQPNSAHRALAQLERAGWLSLLVTQNVDGLHQRAGSQRVVDLHGRLDHVICMQCRVRTSREALQHRLIEDNPLFSNASSRVAPDGDADLADADYDQFRLAHCQACSGVLKPDVVFFGENVPQERVERAMQALERSAGVLIVGSSLMVYSGYRFAKRALKLDIPVAILNRGRTRADEFATLRVPHGAGEILTALVAQGLVPRKAERD
ncbi:MAG TPA: NAD-dependent protein deacetylase [Polyangiaceae bacterium]|nr:NAD-dependent protein deacetylase [Polyangiaceae bacterium]